MSIGQIIALTIVILAMVLAIWNLILYIEIEYMGKTNKKELKELEEKRDYYGRLK